MLTPERAQSLWDAGVNQFNISLDYLDERHDAARGIPGSRAQDPRRHSRDARARHRQHPVQHRHQERQSRSDPADRAVARRLGRRRELQRVHRREERQSRVSRRDRISSPMLDARRCAQLLAFKRRRRGVITNSDYYLEQIPRYLRGEMREPCRSGIRTIHIDPAGRVKRCPDFPTDFHWRDFRIQTDRLQRVLLRLPRRSTGAAATVAHSGRDGMSDSSAALDLRERVAGRDLRRAGARASRRGDGRRRRSHRRRRRGRGRQASPRSDRSPILRARFPRRAEIDCRGGC